MIESKNVSKRFFRKVALNESTFVLAPGQIYALLGPNGSGKTTWMKMVASLSKPTTGEIRYNGQPVGIESRKNIAYMATEPYFYNWMTVRDVGKYYQDFFSDFNMQRFEELLKKMDLSSDLKVKSLSTGMAAKLKIAATLAREAKVYLLDEPLNGIDLIARDQIMETIISVAADDVTLVVSSHLVEELETFVSKAIFVRDGNILDICDIEELRGQKGLSLADYYRQIM